MSRFDVLIVGSGLSAVTAGLRARALGMSVAIAPHGPDPSLFWSGLGDVYGRAAPVREEQLATRYLRGETRASEGMMSTPAERMAMTAQLLPDHPYGRLDFSAEQLGELVNAAVELVELPGEVLDTPALVPTMSGTTRRADFVAEGIAKLDGPARFVGLEEWPAWDPGWAARTAAAAADHEFDAAWAGPDELLAASPLQLVSRWAAPSGERVSALAAAAGAGTAIVPAVLGLTFDARRVAGAALADAGAHVAELAGTTDSVFGLRLSHHLSERLGAAEISQVAPGSSLENSAGGWTFGETAAQVVILACGPQHRADWQTPFWTEPQRPPRNTANSPWSPQPFLLAGARTNEGLAVAGHDNLFAAGGSLSGHDPVHDGTAFGVDLATGILAAESAVEAV